MHWLPSLKDCIYCFFLFFLLLVKLSIACSASSTFAIEAGGSVSAIGLGLSRTGASTNRSSVGALLQTSYFFENGWGVALGAQYLTRGAELISGDDSSAIFLDFPLSLQIPLGLSIFPNSQTFLGVGTYFSAPFSDLKSRSTLIQKTKKTLGALLEVSHFIPLNPNISMGIRIRNLLSLFPTYETSLLGELERAFDLLVQLTIFVRL